MQPSTASFCNDSARPIPWNIDFADMTWSSHETLYSDVLGDYPVLNEPSFCREEGIDTDIINSVNLGTSPDTAMTPSNGRQRSPLKREWGAFLPLAMDIIRGSGLQIPYPPVDEFQSDSNFEQRGRSRIFRGSKLGGSDDDIGVKHQQTPNCLPSTSTIKAAAPISSESSPVRKRPRTGRRAYGIPSRNTQATIDEAEEIRVKLSLCRAKGRSRPSNLVCPFTGCKYRQLNGRLPDFRRHIRTHLRKDAETLCKGVPWNDFVRQHHLFPNISVDEQPYAVPGEKELWIGGCQKTFSRADALKRHLRNSSCACL